MGPRLLVIQHEPNCPPGWFGEWIEAAGAEVDVLRPDLGQPVPARLADHGGLLVLGGAMGAGDDDTHRWLGPTKALIADTVQAGMPFLGICLGHQLAAAALGGVVEPNPNGHSQGLTPYGPSVEAVDDPLLGVIPAGAEAVQWNNDVVTELPSGAEQLATSPDGTVQAARFGQQGWGVQFHPEASPAIFRSWTVDKPPAERQEFVGVDTPAAVRQIEAHADQLRRCWAPLAQHFAALLGSARGRG